MKLFFSLWTFSILFLLSCNSESSKIEDQKAVLSLRFDSINQLSINETNLWQVRNRLEQLEKDVIDLGYNAHMKELTYDNKSLLESIQKRVSQLNLLEEGNSIRSQIDNLKKPTANDPKQSKSYAYQLHQIQNRIENYIETCKKYEVDVDEFRSLKASIDMKITSIDTQLDIIKQQEENNLRNSNGYVTVFTDKSSLYNYVSNRMFYSNDRSIVVKISNTININYSDAYFNLSFIALSQTRGLITGESLATPGGTIKIYVDSRTGCLNSSGDYYCSN